MKKSEFLAELKKRLAGLPEEDIKESLDYYGEIIDDRMEDGMSEEEAVATVGSPAQVASKIWGDIPIPAFDKEQTAPRRSLRAWEIVLLVLGSPIWLSLLAAAAVVIIAVYIVMWSALAVLYAAEIVFGVGAVFGIVYSTVILIQGSIGTGLFLLGAGIVLAGLSILTFHGCIYATRGLLWLSKRIFLGIISCFVRKEKKK